MNSYEQELLERRLQLVEELYDPALEQKLKGPGFRSMNGFAVNIKMKPEHAVETQEEVNEPKRNGP